MAGTVQIALLRAINVGGRNLVTMAGLRQILGDGGYEEVRSLLQGGNLVFRSGKLTGEGLEADLERRTAEELGVDTRYFVRDNREWGRIVAANPFPRMATSDPSHLVLVVLKGGPGPEQVKALQAAIVGRESARVRGREAYVTYPDGIGSSRLTLAVIEKALGTEGTARNWNTVLKLGAMALMGRVAEA